MVRTAKSTVQSKGIRDAVEAAQPSEGVTQAHAETVQHLQVELRNFVGRRVSEPGGLKPRSARGRFTQS